MAGDSLREKNIDWAAWLAEDHNVLKLTLAGISLEWAERIFTDAHMMGRTRGEVWTGGMIEQVAQAAGETS